VFTNLPACGNVYATGGEAHQEHMGFLELIELVIATDETAPCYLILELPKAGNGAASAHSGFSRIFADFEFQELCSQASFAYLNNSKLWLGSAGTRSGWHYDSCDNFLAQVIGSKHVLLGSPHEPAVFYPRASTINNSEVDADAPDLERFPKYATTTLYEAVLNAGDIIYMPAGWWHSLRSLEPSVNVNWVFGDWLPVRHHLKVLLAGRMKSVARLGRDFIMNGLLREPYRRDLFSNRRTGDDLYLALAGAAARSLSRLSIVAVGPGGRPR
jgi:hypothetical protein